MKRLIYIILILIAVSLIFGQAAVLKAAEETAKTEKTEKTCCPVCKKEIDKDTAQFKFEYKEKTFYFCCEKCKAEFEKDPEKYAKCCEAKVYYVCPMKQCNVKSDKPGNCPKCGMELKKVTEQLPCCEHHQEKEGEHKDDHQHQHDHQHTN